VHLHDPGAGDAAAILSDALDVVHATRRWQALHAPLGVVTNLARAVFAHPAASWFYLDPVQVQVAVVAQLRRAPAPDLADPAPVPAVATLLAAESDRFRALWTGPVVAHRPRAPYEVRHPALGVLALDRATARRPDGTWYERLVPRAGDHEARDADLLALLDLV
jgi:hypothetical protein